MRAYSIDLRQRVVTAYDAGEGTQERLAARFAVSTSWVRKILRQRRDTGSIEPRPHAGGHAKAFDGEAAARLRQAVRDDADATLEELGRASGVTCSPSAVYRALDRLGIARKRSRGGRPSRTGPS